MSIRRDIFSVKADTRDSAGWCHVFMTRDRQEAFRKAADIRRDMSLGLNRLAKVVHPSDWAVSAFIAAGNSIR